MLKLVAEDPGDRRPQRRQARRLWAVCGLPDFRKVGPMHHARMVRRLFSYIGEGGHIPHEWFAAEVARLDNMSGDIEALADRLAGIRSWAYIAHRSDWLKEPAKWAERTREVEARLSDALHERLTQRFVDRRTAVLVRDIGARGADALPVTVAADGEVSVGPEPIGHSPASSSASIRRRGSPTSGCCSPPPSAGLAKSSTAAPARWSRRPTTTLRACRRRRTAASRVAWDGHVLARLAPGRSLLEPALRTARTLDRLSAPSRAALRARLERWLDAQIDGICARSRSSPRPRPIPASSPGVRALAAMLADAGGVLPRKAVLGAIAHLEQADRQALHRLRVRLGPLDVFMPTLLKPAAQYWRAALLAVRTGPADAGPSRRRRRDAECRSRRARRRARLSPRRPRMDPDRPCRPARQPRAQGPLRRRRRSGRHELATSLGLDEDAIARLMAEVGFTRAGEAWRWRGRRAPRGRAPLDRARTPSPNWPS